MGNINRDEMLKLVNENISRLKNKEYTLYFFVIDIFSHLLYRIYFHNTLDCTLIIHNFVM